MRARADSVARCHLQRVRAQVLVYVFVVFGDSAQSTPSHGPRHTPHMPIEDAAREARDTAENGKYGKLRKIRMKQSYQPTQANIDELGETFGFVSVRDEKPNGNPVSWLCSLSRDTTRKALQVSQA